MGSKRFSRLFKHECALTSRRQFREKRHFHVEVLTLVKNLLSCMVPELASKVRFTLLSSTRNVQRDRRLGADIFG